MLDDTRLSKRNRAFEVSVAVYLQNHTPKRSVVARALYEACLEAKPYLGHLCELRCLAFLHVVKVTQK
jgi:hypothetical protein